MEVKDRKLTELIPAEYNPRHITDEAFEQLKASLQRFEAVEPVIVNMHKERKNIIVGGHMRIKAAKALGWETFPCVELKLTRDKERELNVRLNKNTGEFDWDELSAHFEVDELTDWGFTEEELFGNIEVEEPEAEEDDYEIPEEVNTDFVLGDLIEIGEHRLLCGDSTDSDQVSKLMGEEKADVVITDPPYELDFNYSNTLLFADNAHIFVFNNDRALIRQLNDSPLDFKKFFVFNHSGTAIPQEGGNEVFLDHILISHEIAGEPNVRYNKGNGTRTVIKGEYRKAKEHKHEKPASILSPIIKGYTNEGFIILDFYAGGGKLYSVGHQLKRKCYGMELDPKYCQVIVNRMLKLDPSLEVKVNGEPYGV